MSTIADAAAAGVHAACRAAVADALDPSKAHDVVRDVRSSQVFSHIVVEPGPWCDDPEVRDILGEDRLDVNLIATTTLSDDTGLGLGLRSALAVDRERLRDDVVAAVEAEAARQTAAVVVAHPGPAIAPVLRLGVALRDRLRPLLDTEFDGLVSQVVVSNQVITRIRTPTCGVNLTNELYVRFASGTVAGVLAEAVLASPEYEAWVAALEARARPPPVVARPPTPAPAPAPAPPAPAPPRPSTWPAWATPTAVLAALLVLALAGWALRRQGRQRASD